MVNKCNLWQGMKTYLFEGVHIQKVVCLKLKT